MTHNGWTNYETWAVKLWLDNEYGSYLDMTETAQRLYGEHVPEDTGLDDLADAEQSAVTDMADYVKSTLEDGNPLEDVTASVYTDLLRGALSEVNWREIGDSYINDAKEAQK